MSLESLVGGAPARRLAASGIRDVEQLLGLNIRELRALPGIGPGTVERIRAALQHRGLELTADPWAAYICARHGEPAGDVALATFFLCSRCRDDFITLAFSATDPCWTGRTDITGYCGHCNRLVDDVRDSQWLLCGVCERVVRSIGRGLVAARSVLDAWDAQIAPVVPGVILTETDPPHLQPRNKETIAAKVSTADFTVTDDAGSPLFGLELKSGKKPVAGGGVGAPMSRFQLDTTDCDDILTVMAREAMPIYLVHAQVLGRAEPPTERYVGLGLWWTDPWSMNEHFIDVAMRSRETRAAAYYRIGMFRVFATFAQHIRDGGVAEDRARLQRDGAPLLYWNK